MFNIQDKITTFWRDAINLVLGIWLIVSPLALAYTASKAPADTSRRGNSGLQQTASLFDHFIRAPD